MKSVFGTASECGWLQLKMWLCMTCQCCATEQAYDSKLEQWSMGKCWHSRCIVC
jgi:hypothetical protein